MKLFAATTLMMATISMSSLALASESTMRPGKWEIVTETKMTGMPMPMKIPQTKTSTCVTKDEINKPFVGENDSECTFTETERSANTYKWKMVCAEDGSKMTGTGTFTFKATTYSGVMKMNMNQGGQTINIESTHAGKRIGDC